jgi:lactoylglutathione lyase
MQLAKQALDVGLYTNQREAMLEFWQRTVGLEFAELLPLGGGVHQLRHKIGESILKINHPRDPLPDVPPSGYIELAIASADVEEPRALEDPDGNRVVLVPPGHDGINQLEIRLAVRDAVAHARFYGNALELPQGDLENQFRCGASLIRFTEDPGATLDPDQRGPGFRYTTIQVFDVVGEHAGILERGGREGSAPVRLGEVAHISFVRDPDGNWIEISQRKSLTGSLD